MPDVPEYLQAVVAIPLQLLAYEIAVLRLRRGQAPQPRKSVTVE